MIGEKMKILALLCVVFSGSTVFAYEFKVGEQVLYLTETGAIAAATVKSTNEGTDCYNYKNIVIELTEDNYISEKTVSEQYLATTDLAQCTELPFTKKGYVHDAYGDIHAAEVKGCFINSRLYSKNLVVRSKSFNKNGNHLFALPRHMAASNSTCVTNQEGAFCPGSTVLISDIYGHLYPDTRLIGTFDKSEQNDIVVELPSGDLKLWTKSLIRAAKNP